MRICRRRRVMSLSGTDDYPLIFIIATAGVVIVLNDESGMVFLIPFVFISHFVHYHIDSFVMPGLFFVKPGSSASQKYDDKMVIDTNAA